MAKLPHTEGLTGRELYRDVVRCASMGDHRTGTPVDVETADWINDELAAAGFASATVDWPRWHIFLHAARLGDAATLLVDGEDRPQAHARSVLARLERGRRWLIVSTPQSGWFRCAGERGCGVALLLGLARWLGRFEQGPGCLFMSNSGHEIGHMGMHHVMNNERLPAPNEVLCWLHLGASIAVRDWREQGPLLLDGGINENNWLLCSENLLPLLSECFASIPHLEPRRYDLKEGEIRWILEQGYSGFALMGPHRFFHLASDGPEVTAPELLESVAMALAETLSTLAASSGLTLENRQ